MLAVIAAGFGSYSIGEIAIAIVVILAIVGLVILAVRYFEIPISPLVMKVIGIVLFAFLLIVAIRFLMSM